jgi:hypothetical protein
VLAERDLALSVQVLQEFYVQATRSTREDALSHRQAVDLVTAFARFPVQPTTVPLVRGNTGCGASDQGLDSSEEGGVDRQRL